MSNHRCGICLTPCGAPNWQARYHTLWSNQHGWKVRVFCSYCGAWTDIKLLYASNSGEQKAFVKPPTHPAYITTYEEMNHHD